MYNMTSIQRPIFFNGFIFWRIKMCTEVNMNYFQTIHHEMGHIEYFMAYRHRPTVYREGANGGFHEAIGDTIALSVRSRKHLQTLGLLEDANVSEEEKKSSYFFLDLYVKFRKLYELNVSLKITIIIFLDLFSKFSNFVLIIHNFM